MSTWPLLMATTRTHNVDDTTTDERPNKRVRVGLSVDSSAENEETEHIASAVTSENGEEEEEEELLTTEEVKPSDLYLDTV